ncbi:MAG TPA: DinB family protein [Candidatus Limnocylindrales bacterium]|nr:DinB family protein [Candidatus Limnocylindrales bacterium]
MTFDPIGAPEGYRQSLLAALGDDDPAAVQAATPGLLRRLVREAGDAFTVAPEPGEWSVAGCLAHLVDGEVIVAARCRWILAEDEPDIVGYDQALWVSRLDQERDDPEILLAVFESLRRWNLDLWARTPVPSRSRVGLHRARGPESYELTFRLAAGHDRVHLDQARRALESARGLVARR